MPKAFALKEGVERHPTHNTNQKNQMKKRELKQTESRAALLVAEALSQTLLLSKVASQGTSRGGCYFIREHGDNAAEAIEQAAKALDKMQWEDTAFNFKRAAEICRGVSALTIAFHESIDGRKVLERDAATCATLEKLAQAAFEIMEANLREWEAKFDRDDQEQIILEEIRANLSRA